MSDQVACIAIVGPDNNPILIRKYCEEKHEMELDSQLFCSLDHFEATPATQKRGVKTDRFLGTISTDERFQIWGYRASLRYKIIILTGHLANQQEAQIKLLCEKVKDTLFDAFMDPFYAPFSMLESKDVIAKIDEIAKSLPEPNVGAKV